MVQMIVANEISFRAHVSEDELRARMEREVLDQINGIDPTTDKVRKGLKVKTTRGSHGGYTIEVSGPAPAQIMLPRSGE